jgi:hypothetical protein
MRGIVADITERKQAEAALRETQGILQAAMDQSRAGIAIAFALLTILGAAGEAIGIDRYLKANTVKKRTISLLNQGLMHHGALPKMKLDMLEPLMVRFGEFLRGHAVFRDVFGIIRNEGMAQAGGRTYQ